MKLFEYDVRFIKLRPDPFHNQRYRFVTQSCHAPAHEYLVVRVFYFQPFFYTSSTHAFITGHKLFLLFSQVALHTLHRV